MFTTGVENQTGIDLHVLQGEREMAKDCRSLARFQLRVPPGPAGLARIEVKFLIDASGILQVAARDLRTGEQHSVEVQPSYGLNDAEVERMLEESIEFAEQDFAQRQVIEARNEAEGHPACHREIPGATGRGRTGEMPGCRAQRRGDGCGSAARSHGRRRLQILCEPRVDELNQATMPLAERMMNQTLGVALEGKKLGEV